LINHPNADNEDIMDKLVLKGDQKSLQLFHDERKFFFVNDETFKNIVLEEEFHSLNLHFCFQQFSSLEKNFFLKDRQSYNKRLENVIDPNDAFLHKLEGPQVNKELEIKIKAFALNYDNIKNGKSNKLCFML